MDKVSEPMIIQTRDTDKHSEEWRCQSPSGSSGSTHQKFTSPVAIDSYSEPTVCFQSFSVDLN